VRRLPTKGSGTHTVTKDDGPLRPTRQHKHAHTPPFLAQWSLFGRREWTAWTRAAGLARCPRLLVRFGSRAFALTQHRLMALPLADQPTHLSAVEPELLGSRHKMAEPPLFDVPAPDWDEAMLRDWADTVIHEEMASFAERQQLQLVECHVGSVLLALMRTPVYCLLSTFILYIAVYSRCAQICSRDDHEEVLLLCDVCDRGYHTYCLIPQLSEVGTPQLCVGLFVLCVLVLILHAHTGARRQLDVSWLL
jgi:hypothetical protein